ncbi:hypothetical protein JANAI62_05690 [Jannaschia pagri]|uniref:Uncharacterized protein n=1 Tax=Jannaschia pagri TaxID=2829797 RepID=A0ABQ4NI18_9RHOB|nr:MULTISPECIES: hypothetical protein [unclassified Jannaschia]GIT89947.1 hypothetical protein JANAI61_04050 [Jannaschia sp. AI_61]GIT93946.1 hypothetical protein JANAI62_05690 [Jannaschia sp. AI_62]
MTVMRSMLFMAAAAMAFVPMAAPAGHHSAQVRTQDVRITVSCARFSLKGVIWDKPQAVFLDDLVRAGYSPERAYAIGNRICRDEALVGNTAAMGATMRNILRASPPGR